MDKKVEKELYMTTEEVAAHLLYADSRPVRRMIKAGKFGRVRRVGRRWLIPARNVIGVTVNGQ